MVTNHKIIISDSRNINQIDSESIDLIITSPPYPMIQMWDELFCSLNQDIRKTLQIEDGKTSFELMHQELDKIWNELYRILKPGSFACINIGDATRSIGKNFQLYSNHARIISHCNKIGFDTLPEILWRKQTNAPNKFMGSGMLPSGAYVTLEHEYILIFRKGNKKEFNTPADKSKRMESSFFWEERNCWFSDLWDFKGIKQLLNQKDLRERSAAFPLELAYRLINMFSLYGDVVLDPFVGTGTTMLAGLACARNTIGVDIDKEFTPLINRQFMSFLNSANLLITNRIKNHTDFVKNRTIEKGQLKYCNIPHGFQVMTKQETGIQLKKIIDLKQVSNFEYSAMYENIGTLKNDSEVEMTRHEIINSGEEQISLTF